MWKRNTGKESWNLASRTPLMNFVVVGDCVPEKICVGHVRLREERMGGHSCMHEGRDHELSNVSTDALFLLSSRFFFVFGLPTPGGAEILNAIYLLQHLCCMSGGQGSPVRNKQQWQQMAIRRTCVLEQAPQGCLQSSEMPSRQVSGVHSGNAKFKAHSVCCGHMALHKRQIKLFCFLMNGLPQPGMDTPTSFVDQRAMFVKLFPFQIALLSTSSTSIELATHHISQEVCMGR